MVREMVGVGEEGDMTVDEQDPAVLRLRRESASVLVAAPGVESVLRRVHERRRVQRQHRVQAIAALSVVLVAMAGALMVYRGWAPEPPEVQVATRPIAEWPVRGSLAGDRDLIARAEQTWRSSPHRPSGAVRPLFAGTPPYSGTANFAVVALASAEGSVAFVTTPVAPQVDLSTLLLRAVSVVEPDQPAIGFVAVRPDRRDAFAGIAFTLAAPGLASPELTSSAIDFQDNPPTAPQSDGSSWRQVPTGVGAWNSAITAGSFGTAALAAGLHDPETGPVALRRTPEGLVAEGAKPGDLIVTADGVLGVATARGLVDTRLSALGQVEVALSKVTGTIDDSGAFAAEGDVHPGNRVMVVRGDVMVVVGRVVDAQDGWRVQRAVDPAKAPETARRVSLR